MPTIKSLKDLNKVLDPYIKRALEMTRDEIFEIFARKITEYYEEPVFSPPDQDVPDYYQRTGQLMESLTASNVTKSGNGFEFKVGFDDDYLVYHYPTGFSHPKYGNMYNGITGAQVIEAMNAGTHGYTVKGNHHYLDEIINEIGGNAGVIKRFKKNLKKLGLNII